MRWIGTGQRCVLVTGVGWPWISLVFAVVEAKAKTYKLQTTEPNLLNHLQTSSAFAHPSSGGHIGQS